MVAITWTQWSETFKAKEIVAAGPTIDHGALGEVYTTKLMAFAAKGDQVAKRHVRELVKVQSVGLIRSWHRAVNQAPTKENGRKRNRPAAYAVPVVDPLTGAWIAREHKTFWKMSPQQFEWWYAGVYARFNSADERRRVADHLNASHERHPEMNIGDAYEADGYSLEEIDLDKLLGT